MAKIQKHYGSWPSKLSAGVLALGGQRFGHLVVDEGYVYWLESKPEQAGRVVINRRLIAESNNTAESEVITGDNFSVRTRVHEYGGADFAVQGDTLLFCNDDDQRLYLQKGMDKPKAVTPNPEFSHALRYVDMEFSKDGDWVICIRERHTKRNAPLEVINEIVKVSLIKNTEPEVLVSGADFYSYPRISPDGKKLAWTCWDHPNMPWDQTALWVADIDSSGKLSNKTCMLNNENESIYQPAWCPDGELHFVSDRSGWWNIYSFRDGVLNAITPMDVNFGFPQWQFGLISYAFVDRNQLFAIYTKEGRENLCLIEPEKGLVHPLDIPFCTFQNALFYHQNKLIFIAANEVKAASVMQWDTQAEKATQISQLKPSLLSNENISIAEAICFPTTGDKNAYGFYYQPLNNQYVGMDDEKPPLIVMSHGGPTAASTAEYQNSIQFWTNRGFAVVDVNYGGSTGYSREYRDRLKNNWGIVDVDDCVNAALYLVDRGSVDASRLAIRGGSAGGYTTYCALTNYSLFSAGVSRFGVADLTCLVKESHKFEVRYLDSMIGPWPQAEAIYHQRSPINHSDKFNCPLLLLQGDEDAVVPPSQSIAMVDALDNKEIPHALIMLEGEQHGFRKSENISLALEMELNFYGQIFNMEPADELPELTLKHNQNIRQ
ncbi:MAG: S9 family peptidase [Gammaproteobacteria bacterium]|nr:S9 family peptidase [Gammaproteobacteria bacterium]